SFRSARPPPSSALFPYTTLFRSVSCDEDERMGSAWIDGRPVELQAACAEAARLLDQSRLPLIAGLGTDVAGARAAIRLAQRLGGVIDHMHSDALLRDLDVMRGASMMGTTAAEARLRADVLLLVGHVPAEALAPRQVGKRQSRA